ncbi:MAG: carbon-nitrogen hydrolase family protein [Candidatus Hydrogenedentes bacterium]|nr:carbon-nitrogen hydrolase family protein [Candidatus Hydrogenedentota bacterium]
MWMVALFAATAASPENTARLALMHGVPEKWEVERNFAVFLDQLESASSQDATVFITPECWLDGYAAAAPDSTPEKLHAIAQQQDTSAYLRRVAKEAKARGMIICFGYTSLEDGRLYNTAGLWNAEGTQIGRYHKTHLQAHDLQYAPGDGFPVWDSTVGKVGIMICADRRWPETTRALRLGGARLILNPTYGFHGDMNEAIMRTRAFENQCYIAFAHPECSLVTGPKGAIVTKWTGDSPGVTVCDIDLSLAMDDNHLKDRRPEIYGILTRPSASK